MTQASVEPSGARWENVLDRLLEGAEGLVDEQAALHLVRRVLAEEGLEGVWVGLASEAVEPAPAGCFEERLDGALGLVLRSPVPVGRAGLRVLRVAAGLVSRSVEVRQAAEASARGRREQTFLNEAASAAEERQAQLIQSINAIVWEAPEGQSGWSYVSDGAAVLLGYPLERWAEPRFWRKILHEDDRVRVVAESGSARGNRDLEYRVRAEDGRVVWMRDAVRVVYDKGGNVVAQRGVMLDITARVEAERDRERIHAEIVELQKVESLGVMAGGIAHDFNNLLTVILGNASLAAMRLPERSPARGSIDDLIANAQRAADLTRQLLAYSGRAQLSTETLELGVAFRELRGLLATVVPKLAEFQFEVDPLTPAVEGDRTQLQQVLMNLATNAAEALGDRRGVITIRTGFNQIDSVAAGELRLPPGPYAVLTVADNGSGMDDSTRRRIFDPFFTTKAHGRGLGLAVVHGIVKGHGGVVQVQSSLEAGTTVRVYLPASLARVPAPVPLLSRIRTGSGLVLVIDDESEVRATARAMLEALGYDVIEAEDGRAGLLRFDRHRAEVRVVLLDMTMPVMSGEEVLRALLRREPTAGIVLSSGFSQVDARRRGMSEGLSGFLQKPYTVRQLADVIGRAANKEPANE